MFSQASVILFTAGCIPASTGADPPGRHIPACTGADTPPPQADIFHHPLGQTSWADISHHALGQTPPTPVQTYPSMHWGRHPSNGHCSRRYASYWNASCFGLWEHHTIHDNRKRTEQSHTPCDKRFSLVLHLDKNVMVKVFGSFPLWLNFKVLIFSLFFQFKRILEDLLERF